MQIICLHIKINILLKSFSYSKRERSTTVVSKELTASCVLIT